MIKGSKINHVINYGTLLLFIKILEDLIQRIQGKYQLLHEIIQF